jgi:hypothetical protein
MTAEQAAKLPPEQRKAWLRARGASWVANQNPCTPEQLPYARALLRDCRARIVATPRRRTPVARPASARRTRSRRIIRSTCSRSRAGPSESDSEPPGDLDPAAERQIQGATA